MTTVKSCGLTSVSTLGSERTKAAATATLDANRVLYPKKVLQQEVERIGRYSGLPTTYLPKNGYDLVRRDDREASQTAVERLSYWAKTRKAKATNDYSASRITLRGL